MRFAGLIEPGIQDGRVTRAQFVEGSYIVVNTIADRDAITRPGIRINGVPVYVVSEKQLYRWSDESNGWEKDNTVELGYLYQGEFYRVKSGSEYSEKVDKSTQKLYIDKVSNSAYYCDGTNFILLAGGGSGEQQVIFATHYEFPAVGQANKIYVATDESNMYIWTGSNYRVISVDGREIDGGGADAVYN